MSARSYVIKACREGNPQGSLARYNTCCCHPVQWGLKKGLRRARRRHDREVVQREADEHEESRPSE